MKFVALNSQRSSISDDELSHFTVLKWYKKEIDKNDIGKMTNRFIA